MFLASKPEVQANNHQPIEFVLPKMIYDECFLINDNNTALFRKERKGVDVSMSTISVENHYRFFNIFNEQNMYQQIYCDKQKSKSKSSQSLFGILGLLALSNGWSLSDLAYLTVADDLLKVVTLMHHYSTKYDQYKYFNINNSDNNNIELKYGQFGFKYSDKSRLRSKINSGIIDIIVTNFAARDSDSIFYNS